MTMQSINNLFPTTKNNELQSTTKDQKVFSQEQIDLTQYFFAKIRATYGAAKFDKTWPTDIDLKAAKRQWCLRICENDRDQIDGMFEVVGRTMGGDDWPTINYILNSVKVSPAHKEYKALPYVHDKERAKIVGALELEKIKQQFNMKN